VLAREQFPRVRERPSPAVGCSVTGFALAEGEGTVMKGMRTLSAVLSVLVMGCSSGTWVDLAAYGAPRNCKDLDGKSKGLELSGAQIVLRGNVKDELNFFARATCSNVGKAWTSDVRCGDTGVQVKCK
jgi:hypothetical protein